MAVGIIGLYSGVIFLIFIFHHILRSNDNGEFKIILNIIEIVLNVMVVLVTTVALMYCYFCRKKSRMTMEERDKEQKKKWEQQEQRV